MNILDVCGLSAEFLEYEKGYRTVRTQVLNDINLQIKPGKVIVVLGPSGAGKSLLLQGILGIHCDALQVQGQIRYQGQVLDDSLREQILGKQISFIPQSVSSLNPLLTIKQQILLGQEDVDDTYLIECLKEFGLREDILKLYPHEISGGMARRVLVVSALLGRPQLVLADEPTPGMDYKSLDYLIDAIDKVRAYGGAVLMITHDIKFALKVADDIGIMDEGKIVEFVSKDQFEQAVDNLQHPLSRQLFDALRWMEDGPC